MAHAEADDAELVARVARGDRAALAEIYERHSHTMNALALRMLRDRHEAEDTLHDVFVEAWQRAGDYDPTRCSVRGWLLLRLRSRCLDRLRSLNRRRTHAPQHATEQEVPALQGQVVDGLSVRGALQALTADQRRVLELAYFSGLSSSEIAAVLDIPIGTVKSRVTAGLGQLRRALAKPIAKEVGS